MIFDFIVIGSGIAGLTSSLILSKYGRVLIVTKGKPSDTATNWAQGGLACAVVKGDSWQKHFEDTLEAGVFHNDRKSVEFLTRNASKAIDWLAKQGISFEKKGGRYNTGREGGHSHNRIIHATDITGREIEKTLLTKVKRNKNIKLLENTFAQELLVKNKKCLGVKLIGHFSRPSGSDETFFGEAKQPHIKYMDDYSSSLSESLSPKQNKQSYLNKRQTFKAPQKAHLSPGLSSVICFSNTTVLATGGLGQIFEWTTNPPVSTGDGIALAYRAGAKLEDLEFIQFHPTALKDGASPLFLISEALRGEGAHLVKIRNPKSEIRKNQIGKRFMVDYDKRLELAPRDIVTRAIFAEQKKGHEVFLDIRHKEATFLKKRFPNICIELEKRGFDIAKDLIPITPAAHYSCGGIKTDLYGRTNIKNLFAFGEAACTGVHGANRLASNSLLESVVFPLSLISLPARERLFSETFGNPLPTSVLSYSSSLSESLSPEHGKRSDFSLRQTFNAPQKAHSSPSLALLKTKKNLQKLMWEKAGIVRTKKGLKDALEQIKKWEGEWSGIYGEDISLLELKNMLLVARLTAEAALKRGKSLGAHFMS